MDARGLVPANDEVCLIDDRDSCYMMTALLVNYPAPAIAATDNRLYTMVTAHVIFASWLKIHVMVIPIFN